MKKTDAQYVDDAMVSAMETRLLLGHSNNPDLFVHKSNEETIRILAVLQRRDVARIKAERII